MKAGVGNLKLPKIPSLRRWVAVDMLGKTSLWRACGAVRLLTRKLLAAGKSKEQEQPSPTSLREA